MRIGQRIDKKNSGDFYEVVETSDDGVFVQPSHLGYPHLFFLSYKFIQQQNTRLLIGRSPAWVYT